MYNSGIRRQANLIENAVGANTVQLLEMGQFGNCWSDATATGGFLPLMDCDYPVATSITPVARTTTLRLYPRHEPMVTNNNFSNSREILMEMGIITDLRHQPVFDSREGFMRTEITLRISDEYYITIVPSRSKNSHIYIDGPSIGRIDAVRFYESLRIIGALQLGFANTNHVKGFAILRKPFWVEQVEYDFPGPPVVIPHHQQNYNAQVIPHPGGEDLPDI